MITYGEVIIYDQSPSSAKLRASERIDRERVQLIEKGVKRFVRYRTQLFENRTSWVCKIKYSYEESR